MFEHNQTVSSDALHEEATTKTAAIIREEPCWKPGSRLTPGEQVSVLQTEYTRLSGDIRAYVNQYASRFAVFSTVVIGGIVLAGTNDSMHMFYPLVPWFFFAIAWVTISQTYIIACMQERLRQIEESIESIHGAPLITWESQHAKGLIYKILLRHGSNRNFFSWLINPIAFTMIVMGIITLGLMACITFAIQESSVLPPFPHYISVAYVILTGFATLITVVGFFTYFRLPDTLRKVRKYRNGNGQPAKV